MCHALAVMPALPWLNDEEEKQGANDPANS
jgi:hypothetical protein